MNDRNKSILTRPSNYPGASKSNTRKQGYAFWLSTTVSAWLRPLINKFQQLTATICNALSNGFKATLNSTSQAELEEQKRFNDLLEYYHAMEEVADQTHHYGTVVGPSGIEYNKEQIQELLFDLRSELFTRIPTSYLMELDDLLKSNGIILATTIRITI